MLAGVGCQHARLPASAPHTPPWGPWRPRGDVGRRAALAAPSTASAPGAARPAVLRKRRLSVASVTVARVGDPARVRRALGWWCPALTCSSCCPLSASGWSPGGLLGPHRPPALSLPWAPAAVASAGAATLCSPPRAWGPRPKETTLPGVTTLGSGCGAGCRAWWRCVSLRKHSLWPVCAECLAQRAAVLPEPHGGEAMPAEPSPPAGLSSSLSQRTARGVVGPAHGHLGPSLPTGLGGHRLAQLLSKLGIREGCTAVRQE